MLMQKHPIPLRHIYFMKQEIAFPQISNILKTSYALEKHTKAGSWHTKHA